jgi:PAS domain S-box-containing protein
MTFDASPAMIIYVDANGKVVRANHTVCDDLGLNREEIEGKTVQELFPLDACKFMAGYKRILETGKPETGMIEKCHEASGKDRWSLCNKIPYFDESGKVAGVCILAVDVTHQKEMERQLSESWGALNKVNKILGIQADLAEKIMAEDSEIEVDDILQGIGTSLNLDSVFVYKCNGDAHLINSWVSDSRMVLPKHMPLNGSEKSIRRWIEGKWMSADCMPKELDDAFKKAVGVGMETIAFVPIMGPEGAWGIVGFGTSACRNWCEKEMDALAGLGRLIAMLARTVCDNRDFRQTVSTVSAEIREISSLFSGSSVVREYAQ